MTRRDAALFNIPFFMDLYCTVYTYVDRYTRTHTVYSQLVRIPGRKRCLDLCAEMAPPACPDDFIQLGAYDWAVMPQCNQVMCSPYELIKCTGWLQWRHVTQVKMGLTSCI